jgi:signal transduction histidine kinase
MAQAYFVKANMLVNFNAYDSAIYYFKKSANLYYELNNWVKLENAYKCIYNAYENKDEIEMALNWCKKAQTISEKMPGEIHNNLCSIGYLLQLIGRYDSAEIYFKKCLLYRLKNENANKVLDAYGNLQYLYLITHRFSKEFEIINEKIYYCKANNDRFNLANSLCSKAEFLSFLNDSSSFTIYYQALKIAESCENWDIKARILNGLADNYQNQNQLNKALGLYKQSSIISKEHNLWRTEAFSELSMCDCYTKLEQYYKAQEHINLALNLNEKSGYDQQKTHIYIAYAQLLIAMKKYKEAASVVDKGISLSKKHQQLHLMVRLLALKIQTFINLENYIDSQKIINTMESISDTLNIDEYNLLLLNAKYQLAVAQQDYKKANSFQEQIRKTENLSFNNQIDLRAQKLMAVYELQKRENENTALRKDKAIQDKLISHQRWGILAGLVILLLILALSITLYISMLKQKNAARLLMKQNARIKALNDSKDIFFGIIAHDLRGPIGSISTFTSILHEYLESGEIMALKRALQLIAKQSKATLTTLENLLQWANSQRNIITINKSINAIRPLSAEIEEFLQSKIREKNIQFDNEISSDSFAFFDRNMIEVVIRNLLSNAIKFTPNGGKIVLSNYKKENQLIIKIKDNGVGIKPERLKDIFNAQKYETSFGTNAEKGTGLGLKICKDFVEKNGGEIWVESQLSNGTEFYFSLPIVVAEKDLTK